MTETTDQTPTTAATAATGRWDGSVSLLEHMEQAAVAGDGTMCFVRAGEQVRWSELWAEAHRCAGWLEAARPGDRTVAGLLEPTRECLVTLLGAWLAGRTFASLPHPARGMGPDEYQEQVTALVELVDATVVATPAGLSDALSAALPDIPAVAYPDVGRGRPVSGNDGGRLVQFTSGSTDRPRGVALDMSRLGANAAAMAAAVEVTPGDVFFSWLPLSHDMGLVGMCLAPAAAMSPDLGGATQIWLSDPIRFMRDPVSWLRLATEARGNLTAAPNFALELVARRLARRRGHEGLDLSSLRCLIVGSETVDHRTLDHFVTATAPHGLRPDALCPAYGLAEATLAVTITPPRTHWKSHPAPTGTGDVTGELVALGPPVPGMELRAGTLAEPAEIEVRGPSIAAVLLGRPGSFTTDGWLRTGDTGFLHDGELYFTGRAADRLVVRGRNLDAGNLQRRLGALDGVRPGCCAVIQDTDHDGYLVVVEASAPPNSAEHDQQRLCRHIANTATRWSGVSPSRVLVVRRGALPKTPSGKLQPHRLRSGLASHTIVPLHVHPPSAELVEGLR